MSGRWAIAMALLGCTAISAQPSSRGWPQFLGPNRDGTVEYDIGARAKLVESWRRPVPSGGAGITIAGGRVYTLGSDGTQDLLFALDAGTGKELWRAAIGPTHSDAIENGPGSTPAVAGDLVIAVASACRVTAVRTADGQQVWQQSLAEDYKSRFAARGGCSMSPAIEGALVILPTGASSGKRLVALDAATGKEAWAASALPNSLNSAPGLANLGGVRQVLYHHAKPPGLSGVSGVRADTGATVWQLDSPEGMSDTMALPLPGDRVLLQTWMNTTLLETGASPRAVWTMTELSATGPPPVHRDGHLYGFGGNSGEFLKCVDVNTGQVRWAARPYRGSVLLVGSTLVMLSESSGFVRLISATPAGYDERARLQVFKPGARTFTPPSFADGRIFVRNLEEVVAVEVK
jgi:outer membrane protein assembly factor BamB